MMSQNASPFPLILGCMNLGGSWDDRPLSNGAISNTRDCVQAALEAGITTFDHADIYCGGKSELAFGMIWDDIGATRDEVVLQTKCGIRKSDEPIQGSPHRFDFSYEHITTSVRKSLERLRTDYLDVLLLHRPDILMDPEEVAKAFSDLRHEGLVWQLGVSNFNAAQIELLGSALQEPIVANQVEFNLLHADLIDEGVSFNNAAQRSSFRGDATLEYCRLHDIVIQAYSPIAKGRISSPDAANDNRLAGVAAAVRPIAERKSVSPEAVLLAWILRHPSGIRPVIGSTRPERIRSMAKGASVNLTREEWYALYLAGRGKDLP